jgi:hypothetical protein
MDYRKTMTSFLFRGTWNLFGGLCIFKKTLQFLSERGVIFELFGSCVRPSSFEHLASHSLGIVLLIQTFDDFEHLLLVVFWLTFITFLKTRDPGSTLDAT